MGTNANILHASVPLFLAEWAFSLLPNATVTIAQTPPFIITNIVPGDFNHDGKLDVLVMGQADPVRNPQGELMMRVYLGNIDSGWSTFPTG